MEGEYLILYSIKGTVDVDYCHITPDKLEKVIKNLKENKLEIWIAHEPEKITLEIHWWKIYTLGIFKKG